MVQDRDRVPEFVVAHWNEWVTPFSGGQVAARTPGEGLSVIEDAPGSYVRVRSDA